MWRHIQIGLNALFSSSSRQSTNSEGEESAADKNNESVQTPQVETLTLSPPEIARVQAERLLVDTQEKVPSTVSAPNVNINGSSPPRAEIYQIEGIGEVLFIKSLGAGHSGQVFLMRTQNGREFALKEAIPGRKIIDPMTKDAAGLNRANSSGATPDFYGAFKKRGNICTRIKPDAAGNFPDNIDFVLMEPIEGRKAYQVIGEGLLPEESVEQLVTDLVKKLASKGLIIKDDNPPNFYIRANKDETGVELIALDGASIHRNSLPSGYGPPTPMQISHSISLITRAIILKSRDYRTQLEKQATSTAT